LVNQKGKKAEVNFLMIKEKNQKKKLKKSQVKKQ
jgi:hypothetical protein